MNEPRERPRIFDWDDAKSASNLIKHGVEFEWAMGAFLDPRRVDLDATQPGQGEMRWKVVGTVGRKLITVVYTMRAGAVRIISARPANKKELKRYGQARLRSEEPAPDST